MRFGANLVPKHMTPISNVPCFIWTLRTMVRSGLFASIAVVARSEDLPATQAAIEVYLGNTSSDIVLGEGGSERMGSFANGLSQLMAGHPPGWEGIVALADANRPLVPIEQLEQLNEKALEFGCACPGRSVVNGVARVRKGRIIEVPNKSEYIDFVTPEFINTSLLSELLETSTPRFSYHSLVEYSLASGVQPFVVESSILNTKLTYPEDISVLEGLVTEHYAAADSSGAKA